ncbi:hypothetical protein KXV95_001373 [Aspergillus fumigatus]|nr:hypothetical protein KXX44_005924 [Aspergillus fumigatus]KAH1626495.1 hypothetical protein KXX39_005501 [Aspergillus fumigatus]KAH1686286.1 hypothetical protein KXX23_005173 [Aspergillus fumigatus]KAH1789495.1 hypothetical protein KXX36_005613 [Aspergillus fumigatus]KAH1959389.1 hypothetical protein KXV59_006648 [Aspergillus fumigatus]
MAVLLTVQGELLGTHVHHHHQVLDGLLVKRPSAIVANVSSAVEEAFDTCARGWHGEKIACQATRPRQKRHNSWTGSLKVELESRIETDQVLAFLEVPINLVQLDPIARQKEKDKSGICFWYW